MSVSREVLPLPLEHSVAHLHGDQKYFSPSGPRPYLEHLLHVVEILARFGYGDDPVLVRAALAHDVLEDTATTRDELAEIIGADAAEIAWRVSDEPGESREEQKARTYPKMRQDPRAVLVKLADRIANAEKAREHLLELERLGLPAKIIRRVRRLRSMYQDEMPGFERALRREGEFDPMWRHLRQVLADD